MKMKNVFVWNKQNFRLVLNGSSFRRCHQDRRIEADSIARDSLNNLQWWKLIHCGKDLVIGQGPVFDCAEHGRRQAQARQWFPITQSASSFKLSIKATLVRDEFKNRSLRSSHIKWLAWDSIWSLRQKSSPVSDYVPDRQETFESWDSWSARAQAIGDQLDAELWLSGSAQSQWYSELT